MTMVSCKGILTSLHTVEAFLILDAELSRSIGKFESGFFLTASCLSTRTEVYTKIPMMKNGAMGITTLRIFASDDCTLEPETTKRPPWIDLPETGTIIILDDDRQSQA